MEPGYLVDNTTKSSTFDKEMAIIKEELNRWFSIIESEYNGWKTGVYWRDIILYMNMNINISKVKIITTIPSENIEEVRNAICKVGAGIIGNYTYCSMSTKCIGTFKPNSKASPYIGENNKLEFVEEEKLEVVCDIEKVEDAIVALRKAHPYEEPAIDIIPLLDENDLTQNN